MSADRVILVHLRTHTTLAWLAEILPSLLSDVRLQVLFTVPEGAAERTSAFDSGLLDAVTQMGGLVIPWDQARAVRADLVLSATSHGPLGDLHGPLLVTSHGPGFLRDNSWSDTGPAPRSRTADRTYVALPGPASRERIEAAGSSVTPISVGDPCWESLRAGLELRPDYRRALGVQEGQRLVVVTSTWGSHSLMARRPGLVEQLTTVLPSSDFVVALVLHANVWVGHGPWQVRAWMGRPLAAGLHLVPFLTGWRGTVLAADAVVGDHGSVAMYAALLGVPTLQDVPDRREIHPGSFAWHLAGRTPAMSALVPLREQIESLVADGIRERYPDLRKEAFDEVGSALGRLQSLIYSIIGLDPPAPPPVLAPAPPTTEHSPVLTRRFCGRPETDGSGSHRMVLEAFPATVPHDDCARGIHCLVSDRAERDRNLYTLADLVLAPGSEIDGSVGPGSCSTEDGARVTGRVAGALQLAVGRARVGVSAQPVPPTDAEAACALIWVDHAWGHEPHGPSRSLLRMHYGGKIYDLEITISS